VIGLLLYLRGFLVLVVQLVVTMVIFLLCEFHVILFVLTLCWYLLKCGGGFCSVCVSSMRQFRFLSRQTAPILFKDLL